MIYIFNTKDNIMYPLMKALFGLSDQNVYETILEEFFLMKERLERKGVAYEKLKGALIPNQEKKKFETCIVIDTAQIGSDSYGYFIFDKLIPLLDKDSTYSILCGDYIDLFSNGAVGQSQLHSMLKEVLVPCNNTRYQHSTQYFLIYFKRLTGQQRWRIVEGLMQYPWFTGFAGLDDESLFKSYISNVLVHSYIKARDCVIGEHSSDYSDEENINMRGYPFEKNGFSFVSLNENSFVPFLSYKIETMFFDKEDVGYSLNALFPRFQTIDKLQLKLEDKKWTEYLCKAGKGKGEIMQKLGYAVEDKEKFTKMVYDKICSNYIYNLELNQYGDLKFNVCINIPTMNGNLRKTMIALKYFPDSGEISIITVT